MTVYEYPNAYNIQTTIAFPVHSAASEYSIEEYKLVGLPGASILSVAAILPGEHRKDWQVFKDNGSSTNFLEEYDGSAEFTFGLGKAFWIINKGPLNINTSVPAAPLNVAGMWRYHYIPALIS